MANRDLFDSSFCESSDIYTEENILAITTAVFYMMEKCSCSK